jgi:ABC-2 type transport system permease protein
MVSQNRYNPHLDYKIFMAPAMLVMILTLLSGFLPALNIVNEKETGTIEQINVSPVKRIHFVLSKLIPYWIVGIFVMTISFIIIALVYKLVPQGSIFTLYLYGWIYILVVSGMGLVIANYSATMQQAIFEMFFFLIVMILISGLLTPISSMPEWAQVLAYCNPLTYFVQTMRMVYLKGSAVTELLPQMGALCLFALLFFIWAIISYRKRS